MRRRALVKIVALGLVLPAGADAAVVSVARAPAPRFDLLSSYDRSEDAVYVRAGRGEANRLTVTYARGATSVTVRDRGAVLRAGRSCRAHDSHTVRCRPRRPGGFLQHVEVRLGDRGDRLRMRNDSVGGVVAFGGSGNDLLRGGNGSDELFGGGGADRLIAGARGDVAFGGPGRDQLRAGGGDDILGDGDSDGARVDDSVDGGDGADVVTYRQRKRPVTVDLSDPASAAGGGGERDVLRNVEGVEGGSGDDRLVGDARRNQLRGGAGDDVLEARPGVSRAGAVTGDALEGGAGSDHLVGSDGPDRLYGAAGDDELACGGALDSIKNPVASELLEPACETIFREGFQGEPTDTLSFPAYPVATAEDAVEFRIRCPNLEALDGMYVGCSATFTLREASGERRVLGEGTRKIAMRRRGNPVNVRVALTELGRQAVAGGGVDATVRLRGQHMADADWAIRLQR